MRKTIYTLLLVGACLINMNAQSVLRENVAIVKPNYTASSIKFITDLSKVARKNGYPKAAEVLESYTKGSFGSGFIYTDPNTQKSYIVTNRHVVAQANSATIEFQHSDKPYIEFKDCPIIIVDEQLDLALIELKDGIGIPKGLSIKTELPQEGTTVYTAGFPGLNNKPSWQLGQGIISNNSVKDKILSGTNSIGAIQHTAQVSAGSSGGPLLVKSDNDSYTIIGVNTWKISDRENTNFSIAGKSLKQFLDKYAGAKTQNSGTDLQQRAIGFTQAMKNNYEDILPYISNEYISNVSFDHFYELINAVPDSISDNIATCFNNGRPIDGVRIGLAYIMFKKISSMNLEYDYSSEAGNNEYANATFKSAKKEFATTWIFEQGEWRLQRFPALKLTDLEEQGVSKRYGYSNSIKIGMETPLTEKEIWGTLYYATYEYTFRTFMTTGFTIGQGNYSYNPTAGMDHNDEGKWIKEKYINLAISVGGQVPIKLSSFYFIPNLKGFIEFNTADVPGALGYVGGFEIAYKLNRKTYLLGGVSYKQRYFNTTEEYKYKDFSTLGIHLGITF